MEKMKRLCGMVRSILVDDAETRDSDIKLISQVIKRFYPDRDMKLSEIGYTDVKIPSFESITRARRKVQEREETLRGSQRGYRKELELEMKEWAVNG